MEVLIVIGVLCMVLAATLNATATADIVMKEETGDYGSVPAVDADLIYEGSMVGENGSGYGRPLVAGDRFLGHCSEQCDNSDGAVGAKNIRHKTGKYRLQVTLTGVAITDVDRPVYASDDAVYSLAGASASGAYTCVGKVVRYVAANTAVVEFQSGAIDEFGNTSARILKTDDYTSLITDAGKVIYLGTDAKTITMLATVAGYEVIIVNSGADGAAGIIVDFHANDLNLGGCGQAAGGDGKSLTNTKATARRGDFLHLIGDGTAGYTIRNKRGTWAQEA